MLKGKELKNKGFTLNLEVINLNIKTELSQADIDKCDKVASDLLNIDTKQINRSREIIKELSSIYYEESGQSGGRLIVCRDGSILFAGSFVEKDSHLSAFEHGFRSNHEQLVKRTELLQEVA